MRQSGWSYSPILLPEGVSEIVRYTTGLREYEEG